MKPLLKLLVCGVLLVSCDHKDSNKIYREYPDVGKISFRLTGNERGYNFDIDQSYSLINGYFDSYLTKNQGIARINRYSKDFQSEISLILHIDSLTNSIDKSASSLFFNILHVNADKTILTIQSLSQDSVTFNNLSYDPGKSIISGDFEYTYHRQTENIDMSGSFNVNIYNYGF